MKKSELLAIYKDWMEEEGEKLAETYHYLPFEYSKVRNAYDLECKEALKALEESSSPLEFFRGLNFLYGWYVFQLGYATTKGGPFPEHTHLDQFIDVFGTEMLRGVKWENEDSEVRRND